MGRKLHYILTDPQIDLFKSLEISFIEDPEEEKTLEDVRTANRMFRTGELTEEDADLAFVAPFDKQWPHTYELISISGQVYVALAEAGISPNEDTVFMEEKSLVCEHVFCCGFGMRKVNGENEIGHAFLFDISDDGDITPPEGDSAQYMGWAPIEGTIIDGLSISPERAKDYLAHYLPGILQEIDDLMARYDDPLDRLRALSDFEVDTHEIVGTSVEKGKQAINYYLVQGLGLEGFVPYSAATRGLIYTKTMDDESGYKLDFDINDDWQDILLIPQNINMIPVMGVGEEGVVVPDNSRLQPALCAEVHFLDRPEDDQNLSNVIIPISKDLKIVSNRDSMKRVDTTEEPDAV